MGTIVCAVDDSPEAEEALRAAVRLSRDAGLRLVAVHVEERADAQHAGSHDRAAAEQRGRQLLERLLTSHALNGRADRRVEVGERANELARVAAEEAASVIVVGSRSRHWWRRRRTSRLTADLIATASCPVVVVPPARRR
jgi:nucleotide-binding universal stress UspA family protein